MQLISVNGQQGQLNVSADPQTRLSVPPIVFLHSDAGSIRHWTEIRAAFRDRTTVAFDRRGHGASDPPRNGKFDHEDALTDIAAVADALA